MKMTPAGPVYLNDLFPRLNLRLSELLRGLSDEEWEMPTVCALWRVKDIAAHLLDGKLRRLSATRDGYLGDPPGEIGSHHDLVAYLNRLNADWVNAARRLSPRVLITLLEQAGEEVHDLFESLDPHAPATFAVAWAGEEESENWFDIARDYTEHWLHQQQIRLALGRPGILDRELYHPALETFMRGLPHTYRDVDAPEGTLLCFTVTGDGGGSWALLRKDHRWHLGTSAEGEPLAEAVIDGDIAWRIFSKGIEEEEARRGMFVTGDQRLGWEILGMRSVMV